MAATETSTYLPPLELTPELEVALRELVSLSLIGKQLHRAVVGPGFAPDGQAQVVAAGSQLAPVAPGAIKDHAVVRELTRRIADVSERTRARMAGVGQVDLLSQDVLVEVVRKREKQR